MHLNNYHLYPSKNYLYSNPVKGLQGYGLDYGFAFNGKEKDNETYGEGNAYDFGDRIQDPRLGRWLSLDPLQVKYPGLSPYNFCANNPIFFIDPDGRAINPNNLSFDHKKAYETALKSPTFNKIFNDLITSTTYDVRLKSDNSEKLTRAGETTFHADKFHGETDYQLYNQDEVNKYFVNNNNDNGDVKGVHAKVKLYSNYDGNKTTVGLEAAGTLFHELWHVKLTINNTNGSDQHNDMATSSEYQKTKLKFLADFKGSKLTNSESLYHKWHGLQGTDTFKKKMFKNGKDNKDGFTRKGKKYGEAINKIDTKTGMEKS